MEVKPSENIMGKRENAGKQHFQLLPQYFPLYQGQISSFMPYNFSHNIFHSIKDKFRHLCHI